MIRTVTDTIYRVTGEPWVGAQVQFRLAPGSYAPDGTHPPDRLMATAGTDGTLSVDLWCNADGEVATLYECRLPGGDSFTFLLAAGDGTPIDLPSLRRGSITPTDPEYPTLLAYIDEHGILPAREAAQQAIDAATAAGLATEGADEAATRASASADAADTAASAANTAANAANTAAGNATTAAESATTAALAANAAAGAASDAATDASTAAAEARASLAVTVADLAASRALAPGDVDHLLRYAGAAAATLTIPAGLDWPVGRAMGVMQGGAGVVSFALAPGVTPESPVRTTRTAGSVLTALKTGPNRWLIAGDGLP